MFRIKCLGRLIKLAQINLNRKISVDFEKFHVITNQSDQYSNQPSHQICKTLIHDTKTNAESIDFTKTWHTKDCHAYKDFSLVAYIETRESIEIFNRYTIKNNAKLIDMLFIHLKEFFDTSRNLNQFKKNSSNWAIMHEYISNHKLFEHEDFDIWLATYLMKSMEELQYKDPRVFTDLANSYNEYYLKRFHGIKGKYINNNKLNEFAK